MAERLKSGFQHFDLLALRIQPGRITALRGTPKVFGLEFLLSAAQRAADAVQQVTPQDFTGFGVFAPTSHSTAKLVRPATLVQRKHYL